MWNFCKKLVRRLLVACGVLAIVLAVGVGAFRLFVAQLPGYQTELQAWVAAELGLHVTFEQLDARWGLRGPELTLHEVAIADDDGRETLVTARRAAVGLDAAALVIERRPRINRLTVERLSLTVERGTDGSYRLEGTRARAGETLALEALIPQEVEVAVRDSRVEYVDAARGRRWMFDGVGMTLTRTGRTLRVQARAEPPAELGARVELAVDGELAGGAAAVWRVFADLEGADLAALGRLLPAAEPYAVTGSGDATVWADWAGGRLSRASAALALSDVGLPHPAAGEAPAFERMVLTAEWSDEPSGGWQLALSDVDLTRNGRRWSVGGNTTLSVQESNGVLAGLALRSDFLRLEDLTPVVLAFAEAAPAQQWAELDPHGELSAVDFSLAREAEGGWDYALAVEFRGLGLAATAGRPGIAGLSGTITTGARSGTVEFESRGAMFAWPELFDAPLAVEQLSGAFVWRQGRDVMRVVGNDLLLRVAGTDVHSSLELTLPLDGSAPHLDIESTAAGADLVAAKQLLPVRKMPSAVVRWLDGAVRAGRARDVEFTFFGPVSAFPFDGGEGHFLVTAEVEDAELEFIDGWPVAEDLAGTITFENAAFRAAGRGRIFGNRSDDVRVEIPELRDAVLTYAGRTRGPLADVMAFLRSAPLIADRLGPGYERLRVHSGTGVADVRVDLPLRERSAFALDAALTLVDGELSVDGFGPRAAQINGVLELDGASVRGRDIEATFLEGPVRVSVRAPAEGAYRAALDLSGEATAEGIAAAFGLPLGERAAGQAAWQGRVLVPAFEDAAAPAPAPLRVEVQSNLTGVALKFPTPFEKAPGDPSNLRLAIALPRGGGLEIEGNLGATRRLVLRFAAEGGRLRLERGAVSFGGDAPRLPQQPGLAVTGTLPALNVGEWLALLRASGDGARSDPLIAGVQLEVAELAAFGQQLGTSMLDVRRDGEVWNVAVESEAIAGDIVVPLALAERPQIVARMRRVYLATGGAEPADSGGLDPRVLPGLSMRAEDFGFGTRRLGRVAAEVVADPQGLRLVSFTSATDNLAIEATGSLLDGPEGPATRIAASITSGDVGAALEELGFDRFMDGQAGDVTASVHWPGPPSGRWLAHVGGDVAVRIETGSLLEIDPGAGRVVGLLSIAALPRRLALDFRDVFNRGFVFDEISGDFLIVDGDAYTDNLKMSGPGAEIGVIGRTGLRDRDYQQQAVVTAEPGNMLPTVGALVAGPGVGAAWLLFTRIFKEPLKGIGRAAYCVTGTWEAPEVARLSGERVEQVEQCAGLPPNGFPARETADNRP